MAAKKIIFIILLIAIAFGAGVYFKDDAMKFYNSLNKQVQNFKKVDIGSVVSQVSKEILAPIPLNIGGVAKPVVLLQSQIIVQTNLQRQDDPGGTPNLPALKENTMLDEAASAKANDMFVNQYFEHVSPAGVDPGQLVESYGYSYIVTGQNLILGNFSSEAEVVQDWMNSPGHRANILNNRYTEMGAAIIKGTYKGETVWIGVQEFGLPLSVCTQPDANLKNQIDSDQTQLETMYSNINAEKTQIDDTSQDSAAYGQMVDDYNQSVSQYNSLASLVKGIIATYNNEVNNFNNCVAGK